MDGNGVKGHRFERLGFFWKKQKRRQSSLILWAPKVWNANHDVSTQMTLVTGSDRRLSSTNLFYFIDWGIKVMVPLSLSLQFLSHLLQCWFIFVAYFLQFGLVPSALTVCWLPFLFQSISNLPETTISHNFLKNILRKQSKEPDNKRSTSFFRRSTTVLVCVITRLMLLTLLIMVVRRMLITYEPDMRLSNFIEFSLAH